MWWIALAMSHVLAALPCVMTYRVLQTDARHFGARRHGHSLPPSSAGQVKGGSSEVSPQSHLWPRVAKSKISKNTPSAFIENGNHGSGKPGFWEYTGEFLSMGFIGNEAQRAASRDRWSNLFKTDLKQSQKDMIEKCSASLSRLYVLCRKSECRVWANESVPLNHYEYDKDCVTNLKALKETQLDRALRDIRRFDDWDDYPSDDCDFLCSDPYAFLSVE